MTNLPPDVEVKVHGMKVHKDIYAVVESAFYFTDKMEEEMRKDKHIKWEIGPNESRSSDLFRPIVKEMGSFDSDGLPMERKFFLATVDAFVEPIVVVPDIGCGPKHKYFHVAARKDWGPMFVQWVRDKHEHDVMPESMADDVPNVVQKPKKTHKRPKKKRKMGGN